jgi:hypothetical protein
VVGVGVALELIRSTWVFVQAQLSLSSASSCRSMMNISAPSVTALMPETRNGSPERHAVAHAGGDVFRAGEEHGAVPQNIGQRAGIAARQPCHRGVEITGEVARLPSPARREVQAGGFLRSTTDDPPSGPNNWK